jgi:dienelactone hydrolase
MRNEVIHYQVDGRDMVGTLCVGEGSHKRPAVLVCHEGPGQDDNARNYARRLAELGYVAFALDYVGGGRWETDRNKMMARLMELSAAPERIVAIGQTGLDILLAQPEADAKRVASIGFCFGGTMSFQLARAGVPLQAAVGFHAGLATIAPAREGMKTRILALIGSDDPMIPQAQRDAFIVEMSAAKADWQMVLYGGIQHSFTNPAAVNANLPGIVYDALTERRSWAAMRQLFDEVFV